MLPGKPLPVPTQKDIAQSLGLSQTAVSLALRNSPAIPAATVARVKAEVRRLGYRPDPMISALMAQRHKGAAARFRAKIAFLTAFGGPDGRRDGNYAVGCFRGAQRAAEERGYICEAFWMRDPGIAGERLSQILWTQSVQGLMVAPMPVDSVPVQLTWAKFAAVSLDYSVADPELHRVVDDHAFGIERVLEEVSARGYRRPGLVLRASQDVRTHHSRLGVFLVQRRLHPQWANVAPLILPADSWDPVLFAAWLKREQPDVVLTEESELPAAVRQLGLRVPRDLGLAFFYKDKPAPQVSGLQIDAEQVGAIAAGILMRMIETNERGRPKIPTTTLVKSFFWHAGRSLRPLPRVRRPIP